MISIPSGAIKSLQGCLNGIIFIMISIPSGAIKSENKI